MVDYINLFRGVEEEFDLFRRVENEFDLFRRVEDLGGGELVRVGPCLLRFLRSLLLSSSLSSSESSSRSSRSLSSSSPTASSSPSLSQPLMWHLWSQSQRDHSDDLGRSHRISHRHPIYGDEDENENDSDVGNGCFYGIFWPQISSEELIFILFNSSSTLTIKNRGDPLWTVTNHSHILHRQVKRIFSEDTFCEGQHQVFQILKGITCLTKCFIRNGVLSKGFQKI